MKYRYFSDCHLHSDCSRDAEDPAMMMCEAAQRQGLYAVALTDHCECNEYYKEEYDRSVRQSYFEAKKAAAVFQGRLRVYAGVELGQPLQDVKAAQDVLTTCGFDFVLASLHNLAGMEDFYFLDYDHQDVNELLTRYFDEILEMVRWDGFDSLAHLTTPTDTLRAIRAFRPSFTRITARSSTKSSVCWFRTIRRWSLTPPACGRSWGRPCRRQM